MRTVLYILTFTGIAVLFLSCAPLQPYQTQQAYTAAGLPITGGSGLQNFDAQTWYKIGQATSAPAAAVYPLLQSAVPIAPTILETIAGLLAALGFGGMAAYIKTVKTKVTNGQDTHTEELATLSDKIDKLTTAMAVKN